MQLQLSKGAVFAIAASVAIAAIASWQSGQSDDANRLHPTKSGAPRTPPRASLPIVAPDDFELRLTQLASREVSSTDTVDIFQPVNRKPPPPPAPPPPPPMAPAFPYTVLGSMTEDSEPTLFLASANRVVLAKPRQIIDGVYLVDNVSASELTVTYLPLKQKQTIAVGRAR